MASIDYSTLFDAITGIVHFPDQERAFEPPLMATVVHPGVAVLPLPAPSLRGATLLFRMGGEEFGLVAAHAGDEPELGFALLSMELSRHGKGVVPAPADGKPAGLVLTAAQGQGFQRRVVIGEDAGLVDTPRGPRRRVSFHNVEPWGTLVGSPLLAGDQLFGVVDTKDEDSVGHGDETWWVIPIAAIMESESVQRIVEFIGDGVARRAQAQLYDSSEDEEDDDEVPALDATSLFFRLSQGARQVLAHAEGLRTAQGLDRVHMDQLLLGLAQIRGGAAASVLRAAGISEARFRELLQEGADVDLPPHHTPVPLMAALPPLSRHAQHALANARDIADEDGSARVEHRHLLLGALAVRHCGAVTPLLREGLDPTRIFSRIPELRIGGQGVGGTRYHSDLPRGEDRLDITRDVRALAAVIVAESTPLPLSIGLLGDWGSGKSFFMKKLEDEIKAGVGKPGNRRSVVQLWFNAWHYIDTNLWASLAASIFEGLAAELDRATDEDDRKARAALKARILERTAHLRQVQESAESRQRHLTRALNMEEEQLRRLAEEELTVSSQLSPRELARASYRYVVGQSEVKDKLDELSTELGLPAGRLAATEARMELLRLSALGRKVRIAREMVRAQSPVRQAWLTVALLLIPAAVLVLAGGGLAATLDAVMATKFFAQLRNFTIAAGAALAAGVTAAGVALRGLRRPLLAAWSIVAQAKRASDEQLREARNTRRTSLLERREGIRQARAHTEQQIRATSDELEALAAKLAELHPDRRLGEFVRTRSASTDYTRHLGVIARARGDFQKLTERLQEALDSRASDDGESVATIDRIVLYIDDLDRCPEDKVVEVLQAVHLLLAFELFVVVVGVDSRWLLHSLRRHSRALGSAPGEDDAAPDAERTHWKSTPLNYLEKIFQVPLTLRPMDAVGYQALVNELSSEHTVAKLGSSVPGRNTDGAGSAGGSTGRAGSAAPAASGSAVGAGLASSAAGGTPPGAVSGFPTTGGDPAGAEAVSPSVTQTADSAGSVPPLNAPQLEVQAWERKYLAALYPLIPTPRAAKRFLNVYRLIRGGLDRAELQHLIGSEEAGQYRVVLLLLAMLTGYPAEATVVLRDLAQSEPDDTWWSYLDALAAQRQAFASGDGGEDPFADIEDVDPARWNEMLRKVRSLRALIPGDYACEAFVKWAPEVGRYSFHSGRLVGTRARPFIGAPEFPALPDLAPVTVRGGGARHGQ